MAKNRGKRPRKSRWKLESEQVWLAYWRRAASP